MGDVSSSSRLQQLEADNAQLRQRLDARHRLNNVLAILRVIVRRSAETSVEVADYAAHLEGRFDAIFRAQSGSSRLPAGVPLHALITDELLVVAAREGEQYRISGPRLLIAPKAAEVLTLAFHELCANAVKFGALSQPQGRIDISWTFDPTAETNMPLTLLWAESGVVVDRNAPVRRGFGFEVLEDMLRHQLQAETTLKLGSTGLQCTIRLPLPPGSVADLDDIVG